MGHRWSRPTQDSDSWRRVLPGFLFVSGFSLSLPPQHTRSIAGSVLNKEGRGLVSAGLSFHTPQRPKASCIQAGCSLVGRALT